jgi:hypothetical protein
MVNGRLPAHPPAFAGLTALFTFVRASCTHFRGICTALSQILPRFRSFKFSENLPRIRVEYGQKAPPAANGAFKPAC